MRRAMRHAHLLGAKEPLMHRLVPALVAEMGAAYPELGRAQPLIEEVLEREETRFRQTLEKGLRLLDEELAKVERVWDEAQQRLQVPLEYEYAQESPLAPKRELPGEVAFKLYDTYGFPFDLTEIEMHSRGYTVDRDGFDAAMAQQKAAARAAWKGSGEAAAGEIWFDIADHAGATEFTGYTADEGEGQVVALLKGGAEVASAEAGDEVTIVTNQTPFYGESGGQVGDAGTITGPGGLRIAVSDTTKPLGRVHAHHGRVESGRVGVGETVHLTVDSTRRDAIRANHSATHLLHAALRDRLGAHVTQKGSLVAADRLRFDFAHPSALTAEDIAVIEAEVNAEIRANEPVTTRLMAPEEAIEAGAMALFGEKYGDEVRVLTMGRSGRGEGGRRYSVELCGGTHVAATGDIGVFRIVSESAVSAGVRRIEALTGEGARQWLVARDEALKGTASLLRTTPEEVESRVTALLDERRRLERELADVKKALALSGAGGGSGMSQGGAGDEDVGGVRFSGQVIHGLDAKELRGLLDQAKQRIGSGVAAIAAVNDGRAALAVAVTDDLTGKYSAVELVRTGVAVLGGKGGGGRPDMAQGGGPDAAKAPDAIAAVKAAIAA
ncbi:MAG: alanine--tRNA ligase, partial [Novosphingobium sp.]|nr:alanine--tRNA ligase [Novosphingobium sp.]